MCEFDRLGPCARRRLERRLRTNLPGAGMEQRTSTGHKQTQLPVSLYPLPKSPAAAQFQTGYDGPPAAAKAAPPACLEESAFGTRPYESSAVSEELLREHLPMVRFLALRIRERLPQQVEMEDLISAGIVGLMDALQKFDLNKKVQFRTYAQFRVRGAMLDS